MADLEIRNLHVQAGDKQILRGLVPLSIVGMDVVEVAPAYDHAEITSIAAANVAYELLGLFARRAGAQ